MKFNKQIIFPIILFVIGLVLMLLGISNAFTNKALNTFCALIGVLSMLINLRMINTIRKNNKR